MSDLRQNQYGLVEDLESSINDINFELGRIAEEVDIEQDFEDLIFEDDILLF